VASVATGAGSEFDRRVGTLVAQARRRLDEGRFQNGDQAEAEVLYLESLLVSSSPLKGSAEERREWLDNAWNRARVVRRNAERTRLTSRRLRRNAMRARLRVLP
jgi:hypothetical protein